MLVQESILARRDGSNGDWSERAHALAARIVESLGHRTEEFQTDGVEFGRDGPRLVFYQDDADLLEIMFHAVDDRRHVVLQRALRRTYLSHSESFMIYDDDDDLVEAVLPALRHMVGALSKMGAIRASAPQLSISESAMLSSRSERASKDRIGWLVSTEQSTR